MAECTPQSNDSQTIPTVLSNATRAIHDVLAANGYSGDYVFHGGTARYLYGDTSITPDSVEVLFLRPTHTLSLKQLIPVFDSKHFEYIRDGQKLFWRPSNDGEPIEIIFTPPSSTYNSSEICSLKNCPVPPYPYILLSSLWGWAQPRQGMSLTRPRLDRELQECAAAKNVLSMLSFLCSRPELIMARPLTFFDKVLRDNCESVAETFSKQYPSTTKVWKRLGFGSGWEVVVETVSLPETTTPRPSLALIQASILARSRQRDPTLPPLILKQLPTANTDTSSTSTSHTLHPRSSSEMPGPITSEPSTTDANALTNVNSVGTPRTGTESTHQPMAGTSRNGKSEATPEMAEKTNEKENEREKVRDGTGTAGVKNTVNSAVSASETPHKSTITASTSTRTWTDKRSHGSSNGTLHASHSAKARSSSSRGGVDSQQSNTATSHSSHPQTGSLSATGSKATTADTSATIKTNVAGTARNSENATWKGKNSNGSGATSGGTQVSGKGEGRTAALNQKGNGKENASGGGKTAAKRNKNKKAIGRPTISFVKATVNNPTTTASVSTKSSPHRGSNSPNGASNTSNNPCSSADKAGGGPTSTNFKNPAGSAFTSNSTPHRPKTARSSPPPFYSSQFDSWVLKHYTCFYDS